MKNQFGCVTNNSRNAIIRLVSLMVFFAIALSQQSSSATTGGGGPKIGEAPPQLVLSRMIQGPGLETVSWEKFKGNIVVLEFWSTSCAPCVAAIPHWNQLVDDFSGKPVVFLSVSDENGDHVKAFLKRRAIKGWIALDGPLAATQSAFDVKGIPHTVIVDRQGKIAAITHPARLEACHLEEVISGKPSSLPVPTTPDGDEGPSDDVESVSKIAPQQRSIVDVSIHGPFPQPDGAYGLRGWEQTGLRFEAQKAPLNEILASLFRISPRQVIEEAALPEGLYDVTVSGPPEKEGQLQAQFLMVLTTAFGIQAQTNSRNFDVYTMTISSTNVANRKLLFKPGGGGGRPGGFMLRGSRMATVASFLESALDHPVIDETHDTNLWSVELNWEMSDGERTLYSIAHRLKDRKWVTKLDTISFDELPKEDLAHLDADEVSALRTELAKPPEKRFRPDPAKVIQAAREQLGLDLKLTQRLLTVVEIQRGDP